LPLAPALGQDEVIHPVPRRAGLPVPRLEDDPPAVAPGVNVRDSRGRPLAQEPIVVTDAEEREPATPELRPDRADGPPQAVLGQEVGKGIVAREDDIEGAGHSGLELSHVSDGEGRRRPERGRFAARPIDRHPAQVGAMDPVAEQGETDRLSPDPARAVEEGERRIPPDAPDERVQHPGLPADRRPPVPVDQVVLRSESGVEANDRIVHAGRRDRRGGSAGRGQRRRGRVHSLYPYRWGSSSVMSASGVVPAATWATSFPDTGPRTMPTMA